jgi:peroxiredoxin
LVEAKQFDIARKAFRLVLEQPYSPVLKDFIGNRLKRLELVGSPAPPIRGTDLDGKPFDLSAHQGKAVLLHFWATWSLPAASQITWLEQVQETYRKRGLEVLGINLDAHGDGGPNVDAALAGVRRFLLDYNVPWPTLMSDSGDLDFAKAYGVADIPANVLIGRDGTVVQVDLSRRNVDSVVPPVLGP